jgi:DNA-binding MurR/RpiR family transcriptional regulator
MTGAMARPATLERRARRSADVVMMETVPMAHPDGGNLLHTISSKLPYLAPAIRQIAEVVLRDPEKMQTMSITQLAAAAGVADSTVSRFVREIGLESYPALRIGVAEATFVNRANARPQDQQFVYEGISRNDPTEAIIGKVERSSLEAVRQTAFQLNPEAVEAAVQLIEKANLIAFFAMGSSSIAAEDGVMRFTRAGKKCLLFRDQSIQVMLATILDETDVLIGISDSGQTTAVVNAMELARAHGAGTIGITSAIDSPLVGHSNVTLFTSNVPGGGLYGESVTSKWGQLLVIDTLYASYASRHFDETLAHLEETYTAGILHSRG